MGEVSAAVVAGVLTPAEGLAVITTRSQLLARLAGHGAMALVELDAAGHRGPAGRLPRRSDSGVCLPTPNRHRRPTRPNRGADRGGDRR